ncbi:MAG: HIRAN domain-containing protein [Burkholderiales bacterium]
MRILWICLLLGSAAPCVAGETIDARIVVQLSPLAGFQYHEGKAVWDQLRVGDALALVREPGNLHDPNAVRVEWRGRVIGYVPRRENEAVARQLDFGNRLGARIVRLTRHRDPWKRVEFEIFVPL